MKKLILLLALMGSLSKEKTIEVAIQEHNRIYNQNSGCLENEYMVYWNWCDCDGSRHLRAVGWRRAQGNIPKKNGEWYEAHIYTNKREEIMVRSNVLRETFTFFDREREDGIKHPLWEASTEYFSAAQDGKVPQQKFKRILDPN